MSPEQIVLGAAGLMAIMGLVKIMLKRQGHLRGLLKAYVETQTEWNRKKARAAIMARRAAKMKTEDEDLAELTKMIHQSEANENQPADSTLF